MRFFGYVRILEPMGVSFKPIKRGITAIGSFDGLSVSLPLRMVVRHWEICRIAGDFAQVGLPESALAGWCSW